MYTFTHTHRGTATKKSRAHAGNKYVTVNLVCFTFCLFCAAGGEFETASTPIRVVASDRLPLFAI